MADNERSPLERFKEFVAKVLTVTKEDVQKMEAEIEETIEPCGPEPEE
jgi:TPP-dependent pyruvate/acetoin dehydrogenase alpha subunit